MTTKSVAKRLTLSRHTGRGGYTATGYKISLTGSKEPESEYIAIKINKQYGNIVEGY